MKNKLLTDISIRTEVGLSDDQQVKEQQDKLLGKKG